MALRGLFGRRIPPISFVHRAIEGQRQIGYEEWKRQDLSQLEVVYQWADGIDVKAGLERDKAALRVIIGGLTNGRKVILACENGYRN